MNSTLTAKNSRKKKGRLKKWIVFLIILAILAAIVLPRMGVLKRENAAVYQEYTATLGTISNSLSFSGSLQAIDSAAYTAEAETTVRSLYVTEGQSVQEGDKLMRLANGQTIEAEFSGKVNKIFI